MISDITSEEFYDRVAPSYNAHLQADESNGFVRSRIADYFKNHVPRGTVLDFGGGTGLDLPWLLEGGYRVVFCERSQKMKEVALASIVNNPSKENICFLAGDESRIETWTRNFPFRQEISSCIANFAVLNCIRDIELTFRRLHMVIIPGGHFIVTVLDTRFPTLVSRYPKNFINALFTGKLITFTHHQGSQQTVYLHTVRQIKNCASGHFKVIHVLPLAGSGFLLIHFVRQ